VPRTDDVSARPRAGNVRENAKALELRITETDLIVLDSACPPPTHEVPVEVL
jgi:hypothetical protein